jgi:hypothetical protein
MFFREIVNIIAGNSKGILIIGGDFNEVQDGKMDKIPIERGSQCPKTKTLNNFMSKLCHVRTLTHGEPETQKGRISVFSTTSCMNVFYIPTKCHEDLVVTMGVGPSFIFLIFTQSQGSFSLPLGLGDNNFGDCSDIVWERSSCYPHYGKYPYRETKADTLPFARSRFVIAASDRVSFIKKSRES